MAKVTPPVALTIAGSDSGAGAGIQADLKTMAAFGVHGTSAITALTAQNTFGVQGVHLSPPEFVDRQIESILTDLDVRAVKTGMLATAEIIEMVARRAQAGDLPNLVVDPVMVAAGGDRLLAPDAEQAYLELLLPHALVATPNLREAAVLSGSLIASVEEMRETARLLGKAGARYTIVKGGHLTGDEAVDVVYDGGDIWEMSAPKIDTPNVHGTGCTFASAIASGLALGESPEEAIQSAKTYITGALRAAAGWRLGSGHGPVDHFWMLEEGG